MSLFAPMILINSFRLSHCPQILNSRQVYLKGGDYVKVAGEAAADLYAYGHSPVLFKPTKASCEKTRVLIVVDGPSSCRA